MGAMKNLEASLKGKGTKVHGKRAKVKNPDAALDKKLIPTPEDVVKNKGKSGRIKLADMPDAQRKAEIEELLGGLKDAKDGEEKKRIRRALRARGHRGGLNGQGAKKEKKEEPAKAGK
jgi:hypothetical protein